MAKLPIKKGQQKRLTAKRAPMAEVADDLSAIIARIRALEDSIAALDTAPEVPDLSGIVDPLNDQLDEVRETVKALIHAQTEITSGTKNLSRALDTRATQEQIVEAASSIARIEEAIRQIKSATGNELTQIRRGFDELRAALLTPQFVSDAIDEAIDEASAKLRQEIPEIPDPQQIPTPQVQHEIDGARIRFRQPDGTWGAWWDLLETIVRPELDQALKSLANQNRVYVSGNRGITEAPLDGAQYGRQNAKWTEIVESISITVIYVATDGDDDNDGSARDQAKLTVQAGIDACPDGGIVEVAAGTYTVAAAISIDKAITVRSEEGQNVTILKSDGVVGHRVVELSSDGAKIIGFTIQDGETGTDADPETNSGGNVIMRYASAMEDCIVENGSGNQYGGGVYFSELGEGARISRCIIRNNVTHFANAGGGGGIYIDQPDAIIESCLIHGNTGPAGGGILGARTTSAGSLVVNCTVTENIATQWVAFGIWGGGIALSEHVRFQNCIVWGNERSDTTADDVLYALIGDGSDFKYNDVGVETIFFGNPPSGPGRISEDPLFVDASAGDWRLTVDSPCKNTGDEDLVLGSTDLNGDPRIVGGQVDMGAWDTIAATITEEDVISIGMAVLV